MYIQRLETIKKLAFIIWKTQEKKLCALNPLNYSNGSHDSYRSHIQMIPSIHIDK